VFLRKLHEKTSKALLLSKRPTFFGGITNFFGALSSWSGKAQPLGTKQDHLYQR
jgi:hypothetical protein